ncbi:MAG: FUSC family protein [Verrucomicrobia bacterium]|nr:FUSC family protein [Verrucomicrobiota bacterium]
MDNAAHIRPPAGHFAQWSRVFEPVVGLYGDMAFRYGLKFGLAGVLAVYISLWARLDKPGWALFTVFVLMTAQYVGAIAEKSIFRLIGTVVGGVSGYLITGAFEQDPLIFLTLVGLVVGGCTALFGQSRYPYAFLLCGMTTLVVASNGMGNPDNSWTFMLSRIEEIVVGIVVTMVVQSVIWPRYARMEFLAHLRASFGDLRECLLNAPGICGAAEGMSGAQKAREFPGRISGLRSLLEFGSRESLHFRRRLETYFELTVCLGKIACAIATLRESLPADSLYHRYAGAAIEALHAALAAAMAGLADKESSRATRESERGTISAAFDELDARFYAMRKADVVRSIPAEQALIMGLHVSGLDDIRAQIGKAHELLDSLPSDPMQREFTPVPLVSPWPPPFWIKSGVKAGLAVVAAFVIDNWLKPPGGAMFILGTWVFTALNAASPGGQGDRRAFHLIPLNVSALAGVSLVLIAARPMLSSYAVMNTILFVFLFVWGYLSFKTRGMTIPMQLGMLVLVGILGLNGQRPISFEAIVEFFFGLVLALVVSALFQRLLWPSLPQWEVRDRFVEAIGLCRKMLAREPLRLWEKTRLALIPSEVDIRLDHLTPPICPEGEPAALRALMLSVAGLGGNLAITLDRIPADIPPDALEAGTKMIRHMEALFEARLGSIELAFQNGRPPDLEETEIRAAVDGWCAWATETRKSLLDVDRHPLALARITGFAERYHLMGEDILRIDRQFGELRLPLYMGDYSL